MNGYRDQPRYPKFLNLVNTLKQKYPELDRKPDLVDFLWSERGADILQELTQTIQNGSSIIADVFESQTSRTSQKGVYVTFPTDKIYFPLLPTSVYGDEIVPATIWIEGHVSPEIFRDIASYTKTEYYVAIPSVSVYFEGLENFYGGENQNEKYKKLKSMRRQSF